MPRIDRTAPRRPCPVVQCALDANERRPPLTPESELTGHALRGARYRAEITSRGQTPGHAQRDLRHRHPRGVRRSCGRCRGGADRAGRKRAAARRAAVPGRGLVGRPAGDRGQQPRHRRSTATASGGPNRRAPTRSAAAGSGSCATSSTSSTYAPAASARWSGWSCPRIRISAPRARRGSRLGPGVRAARRRHGTRPARGELVAGRPAAAGARGCARRRHCVGARSARSDRRSPARARRCRRSSTPWRACAAATTRSCCAAVARSACSSSSSLNWRTSASGVVGRRGV